MGNSDPGSKDLLALLNLCDRKLTGERRTGLKSLIKDRRIKTWKAYERIEAQLNAMPDRESHPSSILTPGQVRAIRAERERGDSISSIASRYAVKYGAIWNIVNGKTWKEVQ